MQKKNKKGFTIVELVVVIAVIGILSAILIPTFMGLSENARAKALQSDLASAYTQYAVEAADGVVDDYYADEDGKEIKIAILGQDKVVLEKDNVQYYIKDSGANEWVEYKSPLTAPTETVVTTTATHKKGTSGFDALSSSLDGATLSTFSGYKVWVLPTA